MTGMFTQLKYRYVLVMIAIKRLFSGASDSTATDNSIFFVLGSGRNGSTLLARLLNQHSEIFLPPEQYALPYSIEDWHSTLRKNNAPFVQKQLERYFSNNQNWQLDEKSFTEIANEVNDAHPRDKRPRSLFKAVFQHYAGRFGNTEKIVGDHSPLTTVFYKYICDEFSQDKFIFLLRHPYDVVLSYSKLPNNPASDPKFACWKWNNSISAYDYFKRKKCQIILVKYEDLILNTTEVLESIQNFLRVVPEDLTNLKTEDIEDLLGTRALPFHENLNKPINARSIDKWKTNLDPKVTSAIHDLVAENATRFGYNLKNDSE